MLKYCVHVAFLLFLLPTLASAQTPKPDSAKGKDTEKEKERINYKDHVQPLLRKHCLNCHNADKATSDLDVTSFQALMTGGSSGEAVKPGNAGQSLLYQVMAHEAEPKMPPKGDKVPAAELAVIKKWIDGGAPATAVGAIKTASRQVEFDPVTVSLGKPSGPPPMPANLAEVSLSHTDRAHPVTAMAASPWAPLLAVAGHERMVLYNTDTLKEIGVLAFPERIPYSLKFSRNGKWLLAAGGRGAAMGKAVIWEVETGKRVTEIGEESDIVIAADISPNHKLVALGGPGKLVKIYDTATGALKHSIKKHTDWITAMEFSPDGKLLASGDRNGGIYVWEAETGGIVFTLGDHKARITNLNWRADSQMLVSASEDGRIIQWFAEDGFPTRSINAQAGKQPSRNARGNTATPGVLDATYSRTGLIATCGRDETARIWQANGSQIAKLEGFTDLPLKVAFSSDGKRLFVGDFNGTITVWDTKATKDAKPIGTLTTNPK